MPRRPKRTLRKSEVSPLDDHQRALAAQEEKLRRQMEKLQALIEEAPKRQEEVLRRRREELLARSAYSSRGGYDSRPMALTDKRFDAVVASPPRRRKSLKSEVRQQRIRFIGLFIVLLAVLYVVYSTLPSWF